jgi:flavin-dependent dehydrogenase
VGVRAYWTVPRDAATEALADRVAIHTDARHRRGYGWVFPVSADASTVCFNMGVGLWKADQRDGANVSDYLEHFLAHDPLASSLCARAVHATRRVGYPVMLGGWRNRVEHGGVLHIGDAAGLADPLTGDGIGNALASGRLLAEALCEGAAGDWPRRFAATMAPELRRAWLLRQLLVSAAAKNLAARALAAGPHGLRSRLHGAIFGDEGYRGLWPGGSA